MTENPRPLLAHARDPLRVKFWLLGQGLGPLARSRRTPDERQIHRYHLPVSDRWDEDARLLEGWRAGDDRAGEALFTRHADAVARFFHNKVRVGAEDLTQATFLRMVEGKERVREGRKFRAWVLGIAHNVLRKHLRQLQRGALVDASVDSMAKLQPGPSTVLGERREHLSLIHI